MTLRDYQRELSSKAVSLLQAHGLCYLAMECRTGKTLTALAAASGYGAMNVLFVTKKKAIASVQKDYEAYKPAYTLTVTNYESLHKVKGLFDFAILDEAHNLGTFPRPSKKQVAAKAICEGLPIIFLSGTPSPESYSQLFNQLQVCSFSPWRSYKTFYQWARAGYVTARQKCVNGRYIIDWSQANLGIQEEIKPFLLTYTQQQAGFEMDIREFDLPVLMKVNTTRLFYELRKNKVAVLPSGSEVVGDTPAALLNKLHQISGGTVINDKGKAEILDTSKAELIRETFEGSKIAIFYTYQAEGELLKLIFPKWTDSPETFQASEDLTFIAQVRSAREGVRLDTAAAIVFYSTEYSYLSYEQARQRSTSKERTDAAEVFYCVSNMGLDAAILEAVRNKQDFTLSYYGKQLNRKEQTA